MAAIDQLDGSCRPPGWIVRAYRACERRRLAERVRHDRCVNCGTSNAGYRGACRHLHCRICWLAGWAADCWACMWDVAA